jgi:signal transduction histidine kinase
VLEDFGQKLNPQGTEYLQRVVRSGARMDRLIQDVLTYSRLSRREIQLLPVSLERVVREVLQSSPELQAPRALISVGGPLLPVIAHELSLGQVVTNLLGNAAKFVLPGQIPEVRLWTEKQEGRVRLFVQAKGIGIKPEYQRRIFGMFERAHNDQRYDGTGVGLAIVRKAMDRMGGEVGVSSDVKSGSLFWIELPAVVC